ncbi:hypothetical protein B566_EDAN014996 [Ephemera danica]|nr:hypothetical protein B566_EDAN014996 [Ephemera danica]
MSSMDPSSIQQILSEASIFKLIKSLSRGLSENNRKRISSRRKSSTAEISHVQIYEALLAHRKADLKGLDDQEYRLSCCVQQLHLDDEEIQQLDESTQKLYQLNSSGHEIIDFLLHFANRVPQIQKTKSPNRHEKMFHLPPEMLDGSLFNQRPNSQQDIGPDLLAEFNFNALPGSHLPLCRKFFLHYG